MFNGIPTAGMNIPKQNSSSVEISRRMKWKPITIIGAASKPFSLQNRVREEQPFEKRFRLRLRVGKFELFQFDTEVLEGKAFPPRLLRGALPLPAGTPRNAPCPGCPLIPGLATSSHGGLARFVPHTGGVLLAARDVRSTVLPLPVERRRRHGMPTTSVPPCGHPGKISSL